MFFYYDAAIATLVYVLVLSPKVGSIFYFLQRCIPASFEVVLVYPHSVVLSGAAGWLMPFLFLVFVSSRLLPKRTGPTVLQGGEGGSCV